MSHFETTVCSRCGGSGNYSFSLMHGTMCYGCNGSGVKFTKRGKAANEYFQSLMMVPVEELKVGNAIRFFSQDRKFKEIVAIDEGTDAELGEKYCTGYSLGADGNRKMIYLEAKSGDKLKVYPGTLIRKYQTDEEKKAKLQQALAYQETLTQSGTPKKRTKK